MNFIELRTANVRRCVAVFHPLNDWNPAEWACALAGEAGEVCNVAKKILRMRNGTNTAKDPQTMGEARKMIADELADVIIYADLLAASMDISLNAAVREKFNEVSVRMNSDVML